jgi:hypothetical protein
MDNTSAWYVEFTSLQSWHWLGYPEVLRSFITLFGN